MSKKGRLFLAISLLCFVSLGGLYFALRTWMPFMWAIVAPTGISFIGWIYYDKKLLVEFFTLKTTKYGIDMGALIFLSVLFLAVLNFVGARHTKTFDFSGNEVNSLSEQSRQIITSLSSELNVKFFYKNGADHAEENKKIFRDLVKRYQDVSMKVQLEFVEMNEKAKLAQDYGAAKGAGEAFIEYKGNKNRVENYTEQDFTNSIIKVTRTKKKNIYFLEGHNERNLDQEKDEAGLFGFKQLLEKNSYNVKKLSLAGNAQIPDEVDTLIIAAPTQAFQDYEVKAIEDYLAQGGGVFIAIDNKVPAGLHKIINNVGLEVESFYVFNVFNTPMGQVVNAQSPTVAVLYSPTSEITKIFGANQMTVFRQPHALKEITHSDKIKTEFIVRTPESSVALKDLDSQDYTGKPQSFAIVSEIKGRYNTNADKDFSMIVASDIDFMSNSLLYQNLNRDLALNSVASLAKESDLISVTPKETQATKILLSPPEFNQFFKFIVAGIFLPLPLLLMIISLVLWFKRRHA